MTNKDFYLEYRIENDDKLKQAKNNQSRFSEITSTYSMFKLFNQARNKNKKLINEPAKLCLELKEKYNKEFNKIFKTYFEHQKIIPIDGPEFKILPLYSFSIWIKFQLAKPFISKDDEPDYLLDNPIKKDKVFKVPMISGSSWKGNLRWAAGRLLEKAPESEWVQRRIRMIRLFGNENEAQRAHFNRLMSRNPAMIEEFEKSIKAITNRSGLRKGCLNFYPSFFNEMNLEVINPHDRKTKAGKDPVFIESVPAGASGIFSLLYVPFDLIGLPPEQIREKAKDDCAFIVPALKDLMLKYGFSAKKSSGFGIIEPNLEGKIVVNVGDKEPKKFSDFNKLTQDIDALFT